MKPANHLYLAARLLTSLLPAAMSLHAHAGDAASQAAGGAKPSFNFVLVEPSYYEYTAKGSGTLGLITSEAPQPGFVNFTNCKNKSTVVKRVELRESTARCPAWKRPDSIWSVASSSLLPIYRASSVTADTYIIVDEKPVDIASFLSSKGAKLPNTPASAPIGFAFKDPFGKASIAVFADLPKAGVRAPNDGKL